MTSILAFAISAMLQPAPAQAYECCYPGDRSSRCVSLITRSDDPVEMRLACDRVLSSRAQAQPGRTDPLAIPNDLFVPNGFQGQTYPAGAENPPKVYAASDKLLSIQSPACASMQPALGACLNYFEVDAYIALDDDTSLTEIRDFARLHPWSRSDSYSDRVLSKRFRTRRELTEFFRDLTQDCFVIRYLLMSSHGNKGVVAVSEGRVLLETIPVQDVLGPVGLTCALAQNARVQFDGCQIACQDASSNGAEDLLSQLKALAANPTLGGTRFLFNSDNGLSTAPWTNLVQRPGWHYNRGLRTANDAAIMYSVAGGDVTTDIGTTAAGACHTN